MKTWTGERRPRASALGGSIRTSRGRLPPVPPPPSPRQRGPTVLPAQTVRRTVVDQNSVAGSARPCPGRRVRGGRGWHAPVGLPGRYVHQRVHPRVVKSRCSFRELYRFWVLIVLFCCSIFSA